MGIGLSDQAMQAAASLALGLAAGVIYDLLRVLRRRVPGWMAFVTDALFWLTCGIGLFTLGMWAGGGRQRLFMTALAALGGAVYFAVFSRLLVELWEFFALGAGVLLHILAAPIRLFQEFIRKSVNFSKKTFSSWRLWYKIKRNIRADRQNSRRPTPGVREHAPQAHRYSYENNIVYSDSLCRNKHPEPAGKNRGGAGKKRPAYGPGGRDHSRK